GQAVATRGIFRDVTERRKATLALEEERSFLQKIIDGIPEPIFVIGTDYNIQLMNSFAQNQYNLTWPDSAPLSCHQASHQEDTPCSGDEHPCPLEIVRGTGEPTTVTHTHTLSNGTVRLHELQASPIRNSNGEITAIIEATRDITDRVIIEKQLNENRRRLQELAHNDPLTGLPNRLLFDDRLTRALNRCKRSDGELALVFLDLDRFKNINDSLGHSAGDHVLCEMARRLLELVRTTDTVARWGGDEFLMILEQESGNLPVSEIVSRIKSKLSEPVVFEDHELTVSSSIGISLFPVDARSEEELLKCADTAMYRAKELGRNNFQFYTADMNAHTRKKLHLEEELRRAIRKDQFELHYQPQIDISSGRLIGMEALVRWNHPKRGLLASGTFIELAEETGLILPLGQLILLQACRQLRQWQRQGVSVVPMAINISAAQFHQESFVDEVDQALAETGIDPKLLELEITESVTMDKVESSIATLLDLKVRGINISIDDFGTGYSSLSYLKRFPISKLKIDRSFINDIETDADDEAIVSSIIALGGSMGIAVLAEGVETVGQKDILQTKGCQMAQGFLFGRPVPAQDMEKILEKTFCS
ncbi:MAG: EAL domain-containing protein, partial [Desulfuromonadales bacterium]